MYRFVAGVLLSITVLPAQAEQLMVTFGGEYFSWREYDAGSKLLEERGLRKFVGLAAESARHDDWVYGLRSRIYLGDADYDGQTQAGTPHTTTTDYSGWAAELDFTHRFPTTVASPHAWGITVSLGYDSWLRSLRDRGGVAGYDEHYNVGYGRLGAVYGGNHGWSVQGGVKLPFFTSETVGLTKLGYDSDPTLQPRPDYSLYATVSYQLSPRWSLGGYYDSYRFKPSEIETVQSGGTLYGVQQPASQQDTMGFYLNLRF